MCISKVKMLRHFMKQFINHDNKYFFSSHVLINNNNIFITQKRQCSSQHNTDVPQNEESQIEYDNDNVTLLPFDQQFHHEKDNINISRGVPKTFEEYRLRKRLKVIQPQMPRLAKVAILGAPNVGKSTLTNALVGLKISSVSRKVHTTRHKLIGIIVEDDAQIEFLDTPGIVTHAHCRKHDLEPTFMSDPPSSVHNADIICVVSDCTNTRDRNALNLGLLNILRQYPNKESILILNKIDMINAKRKLLDIVTRLTCGIVGGVKSFTHNRIAPKEKKEKSLNDMIKKTEKKLSHDDIEIVVNQSSGNDIGWPLFSRVFMVSALSGDGVSDIRDYLISKAQFRPWLYHQTQVTDQTPFEIVKMTIKEKCLDLLPQEVPYKTNIGIHLWEADRAGNLCIHLNLYCIEKFQSMVIGPKGDTIAKIVDRAKHDLQNTFHCDITLRIAVKGVKSLTEMSK